MTDTTDDTRVKYVGAAGLAPFIYFDGVAANGVFNGAIEIELAARTLVPSLEGGPVRVEITATGRLRCSPVAAIALRDAIDNSLRMLEQPQPTPSAGRIN